MFLYWCLQTVQTICFVVFLNAVCFDDYCGASIQYELKMDAQQRITESPSTAICCNGGCLFCKHTHTSLLNATYYPVTLLGHYMFCRMRPSSSVIYRVETVPLYARVGRDETTGTFATYNELRLELQLLALWYPPIRSFKRHSPLNISVRSLALRDRLCGLVFGVLGC
jgi:hypothetical protein